MSLCSMRLLSDEEITFAWHSEFWRSGLKLVYLLVSIYSLHLSSLSTFLLRTDISPLPSSGLEFMPTGEEAARRHSSCFLQ